MSYGLTRRQHECLSFITGYIHENGYPPSFDNIKDGMGLRSKSGVHRLLGGLEARGLIRRLPNRSRSIMLATDAPFHVFLPPAIEQTLRYVAEWGGVSPEELITKILTVELSNAADRRVAA